MKIAIASGKGGTGKTTVSVNLATFLVEHFPERNVVLVDLDVEEPNSGLFMKGELLHSEPRFRMVPKWNSDTCMHCGQCQEICNFNAVLKLGKKIAVFNELCHGCHACSELCPTASLPMVKEKMGLLTSFQVDGLRFIESRLDIGQEQAVPLITQTMEMVERSYPSDSIFLLDSPPGTACPVVEATRGADRVILVTEPTPFGFHDLKLAVETMEKLNKPHVVVLNKADIGNDQVGKFCKDKQIPLIARIPNHRKIAEKYSRGELIYRQFPAMESALADISAYLFSVEKRGET